MQKILYTSISGRTNNFRSESHPFCSVWEDFTLKCSLEERDEDYYITSGVTGEKDPNWCSPGVFIESSPHCATLF